MEYMKALAIRLNEILKQKHMSCYTLASNSGIAHSTLSNFRQCNSKSCNGTTLLNICRGLEISLSEFYDSPIFDLNNIDDN